MKRFYLSLIGFAMSLVVSTAGAEIVEITYKIDRSKTASINKQQFRVQDEEAPGETLELRRLKYLGHGGFQVDAVKRQGRRIIVRYSFAPEFTGLGAGFPSAMLDHFKIRDGVIFAVAPTVTGGSVEMALGKIDSDKNIKLGKGVSLGLWETVVDGKILGLDLIFYGPGN
ncbi:MAG: hypothetical protein IT289_12115 [Oligoflexia bacterium]|nr:hypothetical protein [Oligoflexia bacterium]